MKAYQAVLITNKERHLYVGKFENGDYFVTEHEDFGDEICFERQKDAQEALECYAYDVSQSDILELIDHEDGEYIARSDIESWTY